MSFFYPFEEFERRVQKLITEGFSREDSKAIITHEELQDFWEWQRCIDEEMHWYEEEDADREPFD
jgi:hypothetical protein